MKRNLVDSNELMIFSEIEVHPDACVLVCIILRMVLLAHGTRANDVRVKRIVVAIHSDFMELSSYNYISRACILIGSVVVLGDSES